MMEAPKKIKLPRIALPDFQPVMARLSRAGITKGMRTALFVLALAAVLAIVIGVVSLMLGPDWAKALLAMRSTIDETPVATMAVATETPEPTRQQPVSTLDIGNNVPVMSPIRVEAEGVVAYPVPGPWLGEWTVTVDRATDVTVAVAVQCSNVWTEDGSPVGTAELEEGEQYVFRFVALDEGVTCTLAVNGQECGMWSITPATAESVQSVVCSPPAEN